MNHHPDQGFKAMAKARKKQQTFQVPPDAIDWIHEEEKRTGVKPGRLVQAALCAYSVLDVPDRRQMIRLAMRVLSGEIAFRDLPDSGAAAPSRPAKVPT